MSRLLTPILIILALAIPSWARATAQEPDKIQIDGEVYALNTNPLETQIEKKGWTPPEDAVQWTSNWRGYLAEWKIENGQLMLVDVTIDIGRSGNRSNRRSVREEIFPSQTRIVADWYSGALIIPDGEITRYVHMGYGSSYDHYQVLRISSGRVVEHSKLTGEEFEAYRQKKFDEYSRTEAFRLELEKFRNDGNDLSDEQRIEFVKEFYAEHYLSL